MGKSSHVTDRNSNIQTKYLKGWYPFLGFAVVAFVIYGQSIGFGYSYLDDTNLLLNRMHELSHSGYIPQAFREDVFSSPGGGFYYRPVLTVSFVVDAVVGGGSLVPFRISNIFYHILATWLLFLCLGAMNYDRMKSFLFSLIFLVHPLATQAVAWIPGRNDTLLAVFILASFYFFIRYLETGKWKFLITHAALWFIALLTKETAFVFPFLLAAATPVVFRQPAGKLGMPAAAWGFLAFTWFTIRAGVLGGQSYPASESAASLVRNLPAILPFLGKSIFPFFLSVFPVIADMTLSFWLGGAAILLMGVLVAFTVPRRWGMIGFGLAWFLIFLVPTFIKHTQTPDLTEHRAYLPLAGLVFFIIESGTVRNLAPGKSMAKFSLGAVILCFSILTVLHLQAFRNQYTFWNNAITTSPSNAYNYNTLGAMYFIDGDLDQAFGLFRKAVSVNPHEPQANGNLGLIYMRRGELEEAEKCYKKEILINPLYDHVYYNYGVLYYKLGKTDSALIMWEKTIEVNPVYTDAYKALMQVYQDQNRPEEYNRIGLLARRNGLLEQ